MKKIIALVAAAAMLFALVPVANAAVFTWPMNMLIDTSIIQTGPNSTDDLGLSASVYGSNPTIEYLLGIDDEPTKYIGNNLSMVLEKKYGDLTKWYNYTNSLAQEAWFRVPVIVASDFNGVPASTSTTLLQVGNNFNISNPVYVNGVAHYAAAVDGGNGFTFYYVNVLMRAVSGGNTETFTIEYSPNAAETYQGVITFSYIDTSASSSANTFGGIRDIGANAPHFNARWNNADSQLIFDTVTKSNASAMVRSNVEYSIKDVTKTDVKANKDTTVSGANSDNMYVLPTIQMQAEVIVKDFNGNPLPIRSLIAGKVNGNFAATGNNTDKLKNAGNDHYGFYDFVYNDNVPAIGGAATVTGKMASNEDTSGDGTTKVSKVAEAEFIFSAQEVYEKTFGYNTKTDDQIYGELKADGSYTVTVNIIDNGNTVAQAKLMGLIQQAASATKFHISPFFTILKTADLTGATLKSRVIGAENQVNYDYLKGISQTVFASNGLSNVQSRSFVIRLNSLDRVATETLAIVGNSDELLAPGATRQLSVNTTYGVLTDSDTIWSSSNPAVAKVDGTKGVVTAVANGIAYITVRQASNGLTDTVVVNVGTPVVAPPPTEEPAAATTSTYFVTCRSLNVRKGAGTSYSRVGKLSRGAAVEVYEITNGWARISYNGSEAFVSANYIDQ